MEELTGLLRESMTERLRQIILSAPRDKKGIKKKKVRPVLLKETLYFQVSSYTEKQVFHENLSQDRAVLQLFEDMRDNFKQMEIETDRFTAQVLVSKKGKMTIRRKNCAVRMKDSPSLSHNRMKNYILQEGTAAPFLVDLGVQTADGRIVRSRYDKFRQINRFLEFIEDILPILPKDRKVSIIDFGCGKSYLTFAMYYYLHELNGMTLDVTGLDLKDDVIRECSGLAEKYGYSGLRFLKGDIADYDGPDKVDMVVTLHACDTATDYALYKAMKWKAGVILSVPCCQHEVNRQISCGILDGALRYGLIKERLSALFTDALRADILEENGYDTQVLEFIDMEHTPKNILLRAVKRDRNVSKDCNSRELSEALHVRTTLQRLLEERKGELY